MTDRPALKCALAGLLTLGLTACAWHRTEINEDVHALDPTGLVVGKTTRLELIQQLGLPPPDFPEEAGTRGVSRDYLRYATFEQRCFRIGLMQMALITPFRWCNAERTYEIGAEFDEDGILSALTETTRKVPWPPFGELAEEPLTVRELGR